MCPIGVKMSLLRMICAANAQTGLMFGHLPQVWLPELSEDGDMVLRTKARSP